MGLKSSQLRNNSDKLDAEAQLSKIWTNWIAKFEDKLLGKTCGLDWEIIYLKFIVSDLHLTKLNL